VRGIIAQENAIMSVPICAVCSVVSQCIASHVLQAVGTISFKIMSYDWQFLNHTIFLWDNKVQWYDYFSRSWTCIFLSCV